MILLKPFDATVRSLMRLSKQVDIVPKPLSDFGIVRVFRCGQTRLFLTLLLTTTHRSL